MIVLLFGSSDQNNLSNHSSDKKEWPVYFSVGHIDSTTRSTTLNLATILVAHLPVPPKYHFQGDGKITAMQRRKVHNLEVWRKVFERIFCRLKVHLNTGKVMLCANGWMLQCYPVICAWTADYFEIIHLHSIKQPICSVRKALKLSFGDWNSSSLNVRDYRLYSQKMILATQGDAMERWEPGQLLEDWVVGTSEGVFWNMKCISRRTIFGCDILHSIYCGMLKHWMDWVIPFSNNIARSTNSTSSKRWSLCIVASLDSTSHIARWHNGVVMRWRHWCVWLFQFSWRLC